MLGVPVLDNVAPSTLGYVTAVLLPNELTSGRSSPFKLIAFAS